MTVADNTSRDQYTATSGQTVFPYTFEIFNKDDVVVVQNSTTLSEGTDYTVSGVGNNNGGNITFTSGATAGDTITLYRDMAYERTTDYQTSGDFLAAEVNADFDRLWLAVQQNEEVDTRAVRKPITDADSINMELPAAATRANKVLTFDANGNVNTIATTVGDASSITYKAGYTGSVQRLVSTKLDDTVSVKDFGAVGDGSTDDTAAFNLAIASGAKAIYIPAGTYVLSSTVTVNRDIMIYGDGSNTKIDVSSVGSLSAGFSFEGAGVTEVEASNLNAIPSSSRRYTFADSSHGFQEGDLFAVWDDNDGSYSSVRSNYYKGEYLTVMQVNGAEVSFNASFYDTYGAGTSKLYKVSTVSVVLRDFDLIGSGAYTGVKIDFGRECVVDNVNMNFDVGRNGLFLEHCYNVSVTNCSNRIQDYIGASFNMYPFQIANCQKIRIDNCNGESRWHAISTGGAASAPAIVNRNIIVTGCTLSSQNGAFAGDFHGNVEHSTYSNCTFHGSGCTIGSNYNSFVNNKIMDTRRDLVGGVGPDTDGYNSQGFYGSELRGYNFLFSGNLMECSGSYVANSFGKFIEMVRPRTALQAPQTSNLQIVNNNYLNLDSTAPFNDKIINVLDASNKFIPDNVDILVDGNTFISKNDPIRPGNNIDISTNGLSAIYTVTVADDGGDKFRFDGDTENATTLTITESGTYTFLQDDASNSGNTIRFSTTADGTHGGGVEYTTGVTVTGTAGTAGARTTIVVPAGAPTLYYYSSATSGMGGQADTPEFTSDLFRSVTITNNKMVGIGVDVFGAKELVMSNNEVRNSYLGVQLIEIGSLIFQNNLISKSQARALYIANTRDDYVIVDNNIFFECNQDPALVGSGSASADVFLSTTIGVPYVRYSGNYIKCNGNAVQALTYNQVYGLQEFNNRIDGFGSSRKIWHNFQDVDGSQLYVGGESETTREFYHYGTTQTDFARITMGNTSNGTVLVRLYIAGSLLDYTGTVEFTLEGISGSFSLLNYRYTSTADPVVGGRLIITTVGDVVTLSMNDASADTGSHVKAEIIKGTRKTLLRSLDVEWLV